MENEIKNESFSTVLENITTVTNMQESALETNTVINNQDLVLEKLDKSNTFLSGIFFLICLWFILDFMRKMIEVD